MFAFIFDSVSFSEWAVLLVVFLIIMGPRKIPQTARTLGNYYSKLRRAAESFKRQIMDMETEINKTVAEVESQAKDVEDAFTSDGDESEAIPPSDAYYAGDMYPQYDEPSQDSSVSTSEDASQDAPVDSNHTNGALADDTASGSKPLYKIKVSAIDEVKA